MTKFFNRWDADAIQVQDPGLKRYISLTPIMVPKTGGRNVKTQFHRSKTSLVERLINKLMVPGHKGKRKREKAMSNWPDSFDVQKQNTVVPTQKFDYRLIPGPWRETVMKRCACLHLLDA